MRPENTARTYAKRSFGQNFLVDRSYIRRIIDAVAPDPGDIVVEIGPGRGAITSHLIGMVAKVIAIEVERDMIAALRDEFGDRPDFELIEQDVLKTDLAALAKRDPDLIKLKLVGNLPFYISTAVL
ncbi:MAG: rRNA adenine N-6-methyltransferase family protein, partial [Acidobacteriota bacterium]